MLAMAQGVEIQCWYTKNGTQVLLVERHELPMVDYAVIFKGAGSTAEPVGKSDIAAPVAQINDDARHERFRQRDFFGMRERFGFKHFRLQQF